jgi:ABC-type sulfate transport system substrate-binding protein
MTVSYDIISKFYGLLDIIYFRKNNPKNIIFCNELIRTDRKQGI